MAALVALVAVKAVRGEAQQTEQQILVAELAAAQRHRARHLRSVALEL